MSDNSLQDQAAAAELRANEAMATATEKYERAQEAVADAAVAAAAAAVAGTEAQAAATEASAGDKPAPKGKGGKKGKEQEVEAKKDEINTQSIKGTRDFPPALMRTRNWIFQKWKDTAAAFSFNEYDAPIVEDVSLYTRKAGEEIVDQLYKFETGDGTKVALRPEMTPSLARLVLQQGKAMIFPARWFTIAQCWRFEAIQKGRKREHYQWNMDIIGAKSISAEVELLSSLVFFFKSINLSERDVKIKVNSRRVLQALLEQHGIVGEQFQKVCVIIDKLDKIGDEETKKELKEKENVDDKTATELLELLNQTGFAGVKAKLGEDNEAIKEVDAFFEEIEGAGITAWIEYVPNVVRGLAYYTGIVFEGFDKKGGRAIFGGGRYDKLLTTYGSATPIPCVGFGFGDCVIEDVLKERKKLPTKLPPAVQDIVIPFSAKEKAAAAKVAAKLRSTGRRVDVLLDLKRNLAANLTYANNIEAERAIIVAPDEWAQGEVKVKDLRREGAQRGDDEKGANVKFEDLQ